MWPNPQETADLVTITEEISNGKLHCLCTETKPCLRFISRFNALKHVEFCETKEMEKESKRKNVLENVQHCHTIWKMNLIKYYHTLFLFNKPNHMYEVLRVSTNKTRTLVCKWIAKKIKLSFPKMSCNFKTDSVSFCSHLQGCVYRVWLRLTLLTVALSNDRTFKC